METRSTSEEPGGFRLGCLPILGIVLGTVVVTALLTGWWVRHNFFADRFEPVHLTRVEQEQLDRKIETIERAGTGRAQPRPERDAGDARDADGRLAPERYSEAGADREVELTERELNSLIASNPRTAEQVAIDLDEDLVSVKLVAPLDEELPFLGGTTLRLNMGVKLAFRDGQPEVALQGVSLGGVPIPNAWLGELKYKNLVEEFGTEGGFWSLFAKGVQDLAVKPGKLRVVLRP